MIIKNTRWITKRNIKQQKWIRAYLSKNYPDMVKTDQFTNEELSNRIKEGGLITEHVRTRMESAWHSHLSRQKDKTRSIEVSSEIYNIVKADAKSEGTTVREYVEKLLKKKSLSEMLASIRI